MSEFVTGPHCADRKSLEAILSHHGLEKTKLEYECSPGTRNEIALELETWEVCQHLARTGLKFTDTIIAAIARENKTGDDRKIALLSTWTTRCKTKATYFKLAQALYSAELDHLVDKLCETIDKYSHLKQDSTRDPQSNEGIDVL